MANFLSNTRAANVSTRMGPDLRTAIEYHPALAGLALWVRFSDVQDAGMVAATDGKIVFAGDLYSKYAPKERLFILLHELLHVALAHPVRSRQLQTRYTDFDHFVYNIACDALINVALEHGAGIVAPADAVMLQPLLKRLGLWNENDKIEQVVRRWSSEALYLAIMKQRDKIVQGGCCLYADLLQDGKASGGKFPLDLRESKLSITEGEGEIRDWARRLQLARGVVPGALERLAGEIPTVKTPWERVLRDQLHRRLHRTNEIDHTRPNRRWLGLEYDMQAREGVALPFEPDRSRPGRAGRVAVAVDTSGSIDGDMLNRFTAELAAIMARTNSDLLLIVCDADVHQVEELQGHAGQLKLRNFKYKGGGGTDFRPAIARAVAWKPDVMVYLTDLYGPCGDAPKFPVIWALPPDIPFQQPPWGLVLELS